MKTSEYALIAKGIVLPICIILSSSVSFARESDNGGGSSGRWSSQESHSRDDSQSKIDETSGTSSSDMSEVNAFGR